MKILLPFFVLLIISTSIAQRNADNYYSAGYYSKAISLYKEYLSKGKSNSTEYLRKLGDCYYMIKDYESSNRLFEKVYSEQPTDSLTLIRLVEIKRTQGDYDSATRYFEEYVALYLPGDSQSHFASNFRLQRLEFPKDSIKSLDLINFKVLRPSLSGVVLGYDLLSNGDLIAGVKTTKTKESQLEDFAQYKYELGVYSKASAYKDFSLLKNKSESIFYNTFPTVDKKNKTIYFSANRTKATYSSKNIENTLQIYSVPLEGNGRPELLSFNDEKYNFSHPYFSESDQRLYFVSDMSLGFGGFDIYYVQKTPLGWSDPINLGENVNTEYNEGTPFVIHDSLIFSSYGHENLGGSDLFYSHKENGGEFGKATNLGKPYNSSSDDLGFVMSNDGETVFISSNRGRLGSSLQVFKQEGSLFQFTLIDPVTNKPIANAKIKVNGKEYITDSNGMWSSSFTPNTHVVVTVDHPEYMKAKFEYDSFSKDDLEDLKMLSLTKNQLKGVVKDQITGKPIANAKSDIYVKEGNEWVLIDSTMTNENGEWAFDIRSDKEYKVSTSKDKYSVLDVFYDRLDKYEDPAMELMRRKAKESVIEYKIEKDLVINIDNIYFDFNSSKLRASSYIILDRVKELMYKNKTMRIELSAHTDCIGGDRYNMKLSEKRANSSKKYLVDNGISSNRIVAKGYGETKMIIKDCELQRNDDSMAQKNRRVELKVL